MLGKKRGYAIFSLSRVSDAMRLDVVTGIQLCLPNLMMSLYTEIYSVAKTT